MTCSHSNHITQLQRAARKRIARDLKKGNRYRCSPPEAFRSHHRAVVNHTLLRRQFVRSEADCSEDILDEAADDISLRAKVKAFLRVWNGDWKSSTIQHYCDGSCGSSIDDCIEVMFGTLIALDLLMSSDFREPSMDDWFTYGYHAARTSAGVMVHNLLPHVIEEGLPAWGDMVAAPNDRPHTDNREAADFRLQIAKKAWRTRCFLRDPHRLLNICLLCFIAVHIETLMAHLMYLDSTKTALFDVVYNDVSNPFVRCRERISKMLTDGKRGSLGVLLAVTHASLHGFVWADARSMAVDFNSQLGWRFRVLLLFPLQWAGFVHPRLMPRQQASYVIAFFKLHPCCRTTEFCDKVFDLFEGDEQKMLSSRAWRELVFSFVAAFRWTNMYSERLLARIRKAVSDVDGMDAERVRCAGLLTQLLCEHYRLGHAPPACLTRADVENLGVKLRRHREGGPKSDKLPSPPKNGFCYWLGLERTKAERMDAHSYKEWLSAKGRLFVHLSPDEQAVFFGKAMEAHARRIAALRSAPTDPCEDHGFLRSLPMLAGDESSPFSEKEFLKQMRRICGVEDGAAIPGIYRTAEKFREELDTTAVIKDTGLTKTKIGLIS